MPPEVEATVDEALASDEQLAALASDGRWEELIGAAGERLAASPGEATALYWSGRGHLERGRSLLAGSRFAQDLGRGLLRRAAEALAAVPRESFADAHDWSLLARYLAGDDEALAADLERAAAEGSPFAARVRGWLARDGSDPAAAAWLERAARAQPADPEVRLEWAGELAALGQRARALEVLEEARALGADRDSWLARLLATLPGPENAAELLRRLDPLRAAPGGETDAPLALYYAWGLEESGRPAEAEAVLARATEGRRPEIDRHHAQVLLILKRPRDAVELVAPLAEAGDPEALEILVSAADVQAQLFDWQGALATYDRALAIEPAQGRAAANRALTQARSGAAMEGYRELVAASPRRADLLNDAGLAEAARGHVAEARALLERAAAQPMDEPGALDARENLASLLLALDPPETAAALRLLDDVLMARPDRDRALTLRSLARRLSR